MQVCVFILCLCLLAKNASTQNIETRSVTLIKPIGSAKINFGTSMVVTSTSSSSQIYIGAPRYGYSPKSVSPGAVFNCVFGALNPGEKICSNKINTGRKDSFGLSMTNTLPPLGALACAPSYTYECRHGNAQIWMLGSCYQLMGNIIREVTNPCEAEISCPTAKPGKTVVDIVFVVDHSGSVGSKNFIIGLEWINKVLAGFNASIDAGDIRVGVVKYGSKATVSIGIQTQPFSALTTSVLDITYGSGGTATHLGIDLAVNEFKTKTKAFEHIPRLMIIMTDGYPNSRSLAITSSQNARNQGITIVAVGIGSGVKRAQLLEMANNNETHVLEVSDFTKLDTILGTLKSVIKQTASVQLESSVSNQTSKFTSCIFGTATSSTPDGYVATGMAGSYDRAGSFAFYNSISRPADLLNLTGLETIMSPENITHLRDSYLGYSTTIGNFSGGAPRFVVSGSPRYHSKGQVIILASSDIQNPTHYHFSIHPHGRMWQIGAYFGHSVLASDVNGDGYDDLLVSAPLYSEQVSYDQGRVFVYMNDPVSPGPNKWVGSSTLILHGSKVNRARFGFSMESVGDVDLNGYNDVIVGAPGETMTSSGSGAVYVYYASANGLSDAYKQRIEGSSVAPSLVNFGYSLGKVESRGSDFDHNLYPDVLVGAPSSDRVIVLRARPIVDVTGRVTVRPATIDVNKCLNDVTKPCAVFETCIRAYGRNRTSAGSYDMVTTLSLDSLRGSTDSPRLVLLGNDTTSSQVYVTSSELCRSYNARLNVAQLLRKGGLTDPIRVTFSYDFSSQHQNRHMSPVIDPLSDKSAHADWLIDNGCHGNNSTCTSDLTLDVAYSIQPSSEAYVIKTGEDVLSVSVTISNRGPDHAFSTKLEVDSPMIRVSQIISACAQLLTTESINGKAVVTLTSSGLVMPVGSKCLVELRYAFQSLTRKASVDKLVIQGQVLSGYENSVDPNPSNNNFNFERKLKYDVNLIASSQTSTDSVIFNHTRSRKIINFIHDPVLPPVEHKFTIYNRGQQMLSSAKLTFKWTDKTLSGYQLLYLYDLACSPPTKCICETNRTVNSLGIPLTNNTKFNHSLRFPPTDEAPLPKILTCDNAKCGTILCHVTDLEVFTSLVVKARFVVWTPSLVGSYVDSSLTSMVVLDTSLSPIFPAQNYFSEVSTNVKNYQALQVSPVSEGINVGVIIGGVLGALTLLAIIIAGLWKMGFFKSKYRDMLEEARGQADCDDTVQEQID